MNINLLTDYLNDHLAGATTATEIIERLIAQNDGEPLGNFAAELLKEIESDEAELKTLLKRLDGLPGPVKKAVAWTGAKLTAPKLGRSAGDFGNFQAMEMLSVGILGKRALWRMLSEVQSSDARLAGTDYSRLIERAESQFTEVEQWRIRLGAEALTSDRIEADHDAPNGYSSPVH